MSPQHPASTAIAKIADISVAPAGHPIISISTATIKNTAQSRTFSILAESAALASL
jgi:hypothetical protein